MPLESSVVMGICLTSKAADQGNWARDWESERVTVSFPQGTQQEEKRGDTRRMAAVMLGGKSKQVNPSQLERAYDEQT